MEKAFQKEISALERAFRRTLNLHNVDIPSLSKKAGAVDLRVSINKLANAAEVSTSVLTLGRKFFASQLQLRSKIATSGLEGHLKLDRLLRMAAIGHASGWGAPAQLNAASGAAASAAAATAIAAATD